MMGKACIHRHLLRKILVIQEEYRTLSRKIGCNKSTILAWFQTRKRNTILKEIIVIKKTAIKKVITVV